MSGTDTESAIIDQALVFYQQHLASERQKQERHLPRNGKSVATPEDVSRDHVFERQLQTIAAILESRKRSLDVPLGDITLPKSTNSPLPQLPKWDDSDSDPYINPITGQWIVPETLFTPGPSKSGSISDELGLVEAAKSMAIIDDAPSHNDSVPDVLHSISKPADRKVNAPATRNQSNPSKSLSIKRKPVNSSQPTRQNTPDSLSFATSKATTSSCLTAGATDPKPGIVRPGSLDLPKPLHIDKQSPRPGGSQNSQETPWSSATKHVASVTEITTSPMRTTSQQNREPSWSLVTPNSPIPVVQIPGPPMPTTSQSRELSSHSATSNYPMPVVQKPGTSLSTKSQQSQETSWDLVTPNFPMLAAKVAIPGHPAASQGNRKPSWSSMSTAGLDGRRTLIATEHSTQPSGPSVLPDHPMTTSDRGSRQHPALNLAELGKFPSEQGVGSASALSGGSEEFGHGPGIAHPKSSDRPSLFSSLKFANDPSISAKLAQPSSMVPNGPRPPFLNSIQRIRPNEIQSFNSNPTERTRKYDESPGADIDNALRLAAGIAQQFASLIGEAGTNNDPSPDNVSTAFAPGNRPFHEHHLDSMRSHGDVSQGYYVPFQMGNPNGMSMHGVEPLNTGRDLLNRTSEDHHAFGPWGGQNGIIPNQMKQFGFKPEQRHSADHRSGQPMMNDRSLGNEGLVEAQFWPRDQEDAQMAQIIADRADRAELEALQRIQDEWNREDDMRLAKQQEVARRIQDEWNGPYAQDFGGHRRHSPPDYQRQTQPKPRQREWPEPGADPFAGHLVSRRDPIPWNPSRRDSDDSVEFAPSLDDDGPHPAVAKEPRESSPLPAQRLTPAQRNFDATKAAEEEIRKYEAAHREREEKAKQAQLEKDKAGKAEKANQTECTACGDRGDKAEMAVLACAHAYDGDCIAQAFQHALAGGKLFHCCNKMPVPIDLAAPFLPAQFVTTYKAKMLEIATPNPIYCAVPGCSTFIPMSAIKGDMSTCPACSSVTCRLCKNPEHKGLCPPDKNSKKLLDLASNKNWRQCRRCNVVVEREEGCLHITCRCGYEFCYSCSGLWSQCGGKCPRSY